MKKKQHRLSNRTLVIFMLLLGTLCIFSVIMLLLPEDSAPKNSLPELHSESNENQPSQESTPVISETEPESTPPAPDPLTDRSQTILSEMTLAEKVGQMFIARCPQEDAARKAAEYYLGGYILFGRDFSDKAKDEVIQDIQSYQDAAWLPLFIGVDEEGGTVNRVSKNPDLRSTPFLSPQALYAEGGFERIHTDTLEKCELLSDLGINLNFAPVCDVSQDPDDFIYARSFGEDARQTAEYVKTVVEAMEAQGMGSIRLRCLPRFTKFCGEIWDSLESLSPTTL